MPEEAEPPQPPPDAPSIFGDVPPDEFVAHAESWQPPELGDVAGLFPGYAVLGLLGRGAMAAVYQARQIELDRLVAIKLLPLEVSVDHDFADRFRREARALGRLHHPHIVRVFDFGTTRAGHLFFFMEYIGGANLRDVIRQVPLDADQALAVTGQICAALACAHGKGIVHRDIKPSNVLLDSEGQVKVADFGLARLSEVTAESLAMTVTGMVMGTPAYMAPEQMKGMDVDHPLHAAQVEVMQVLEVHIGFVEDDDLAFLQPRADLTGTLVVMLASGIDDGKGGQEAAQPEAQVHLRRRLAPPVLRPVHAVGHQLHHGGVHRVDAHFEAVQQRAPGMAARALPHKTAVMALEVGERAPEHQLGKLRVAHLVGVGEVVARGRRETEGGDGPCFEPQPVADIVETQSVGELSEEHRAEVTEHGVSPGFAIDTSLLGCPVDDVTRNELEHLPEKIDVVTCWLGDVSGC